MMPLRLVSPRYYKDYGKEVLIMKKVLKKKIINTSFAVRYFSGETMSIANMGSPGEPTPCVGFC